MTTRRGFLQSLAAGPVLYSGIALARPEENRKAAGKKRAASMAGAGRGNPGRSAYLPDLPLVTHEGRMVRFYEDLVQDRMVVINMMYAACTNICPPNTANLLQVQKALGDRVGREVFMYSITLQPEFDTPQVLQDYMGKYGIARGWTFLTGKRRDIDLLRRKLGFFDPNPVIDANLSEHTGMLRLGHDRRDRWSMIPAAATTRQITNAITDYL